MTLGQICPVAMPLLGVDRPAPPAGLKENGHVCKGAKAFLLRALFLAGEEDHGAGCCGQCSACSKGWALARAGVDGGFRRGALSGLLRNGLCCRGFRRIRRCCGGLGCGRGGCRRFDGNAGVFRLDRIHQVGFRAIRRVGHKLPHLQLQRDTAGIVQDFEGDLPDRCLLLKGSTDHKGNGNLAGHGFAVFLIEPALRQGRRTRRP